MSELMSAFESAKRAIYEHVGFVEDWVVYAINDCTDFFWNEDGDEVTFADSREQLEDDENGDRYTHEIYKQRFYKKWVFRGEKLTMIIADTHTDGNRFFDVFSNDKEIK